MHLLVDSINPKIKRVRKAKRERKEEERKESATKRRGKENKWTFQDGKGCRLIYWKYYRRNRKENQGKEKRKGFGKNGRTWKANRRTQKQVSITLLSFIWKGDARLFVVSSFFVPIGKAKLKLKICRGRLLLVPLQRVKKERSDVTESLEML